MSPEPTSLVRVTSRVEDFMWRAGYRNISGLKLLLRELLSPVSGPGGPGRRERVVCCSVQLNDDDSVLLNVGLPAGGFDWEAYLCQGSAAPGRGPDAALLSALAEDIDFDSGKGSVTVRAAVARSSSFTVRREEGRAIIKPRVDLDSGAAGELSLLLLEMLHSRQRSFVLDLEGVGTVGPEFRGVLLASIDHLTQEYPGASLAVINASDDLLEEIGPLPDQRHLHSAAAWAL